MKKLKISPSLTGTPLTEQELKSIIGGKVNYTRTCHCTLTHSNGLVTSKYLTVKDETECSISCASECSGDCIKNSYVYTYISD